MRRLLLWIVRVFVGIAALAAACVGLVYYLAARSLPDYGAEVSVQANEVSAAVEIVRDTYAIPHIFGEQDEDVFFGLGYTHAQDRLWQMTMFRRTAQGRLSERFGESTVVIDGLLRRLDFYGAARDSVSAQSPEVQDALVAYSNGVNARLREINSRALGRGAPEFFLFSPDVAPWTPADSIAVMKLMGLQLSTHLTEEVTRARVALAVSPERVADIMPDSPGAVAVLDQFGRLFEGGPMPTDHAGLLDHPLSPLPKRGFGGASNAWAAAPHRSTSGGALLANDPHLELTAPSIWYLAHLGFPGGGAIGGTIPGIPTVFAGRNRDFAWGVTSAYVDEQDLFLEELNPDNPNEYRTPDGFEPFAAREEVILVQGGEARTITVQRTANGPVMPGAVYDLASVTPPGFAMSLGWTVFSRTDTTMTGAMSIMRSRSVDEAIEAGQNIVGPAQMLTMADEGRVAMQVIGHIPKRDINHETQGRLPSRGWVEANRWDGVFPYEDNPRFDDPDQDVVGNTNNQIIDAPFPRHVSFTWGDSQRVQRWQRLMEAREVHSRDSFIEAQLDTISVSARTLLPLVAKDLWFTSEPGAPGTPQRRRSEALELLANWNGEMNEHLPEPLIYSAWMRHLQNALIVDELGGPLASEFPHLEPLFIERVFRNIDGAAEWCDIVQSVATETCTEIASRSLDAALVWLDETYGGEVTNLRWGNAHQATHDHAVLGDLPVIGWLVNIRQSTSGGDQTLQRGQTSGEPEDPFLNTHSSGYRGVYDLGDPNGSVFINSTGQSGHPLSRHYDDQSALWRRGEYVPMSLDPDFARAGAVGVTKLVPLP
ncbi:MAG: penicillin acylase family protein [Pseudomonadota bacterium]